MEKEQIAFKKLKESSTGETVSIDIPEGLSEQDYNFLKESGKISKALRPTFKDRLKFKFIVYKSFFTFDYWTAKFIASMLRKQTFRQNMINSNNQTNAYRHQIMFLDEFWNDSFGLVNALPWWCPFNVLLHNWIESDKGYLHDHPRWSITIVLRGALVEETPTKLKWLTAGSIVFRPHKYIHRIIVPNNYKNETWTLFIVGRRKYKQSYYDSRGKVLENYPEVFPINNAEKKGE